jgi:hypothetical protein
METLAKEENDSPSLFRFLLGFVVVGIAWGFTTPFMRRAAVGYKAPARPFLEDEKVPLMKRRALSIWYGVTDLLRRPTYFVPLLLNLSGSVWFFLIAGQAGLSKRDLILQVQFADSLLELSLTVPITNSLAFLFTVLGEWWAEGKVIPRGMTAP